ncbi:MAG: fibronectin type III domain-containing protein [Bacteroidales bacterium]|nr:fibronectin type III domain-containing protein [Bacteroidales bacterium]
MQKFVRILLVVALMALPCCVQAQGGCTLRVTMSGLLGDSWEGSALDCYVNGALAFEAELYSAAATYDSVVYALDETDSVRFVWVEGLHAAQCGFTITVGDAVVTSTTNAGNSFVDGEVVGEFVGCTTCPAPVSLRATYFTPTSVMLQWAGEPNATYSVTYRGEGEDTYTNIMAPTNSYLLSGLDTLTVYYVKVCKICSATDVSPFGNEIVFMTPATAGGRTILNYDAYMQDTTDANNLAYYGLPMGQQLWGSTFTQTIIDSAFMAGMEGLEISHFGFNALNDNGASYLNGVAVYLANIPEDTFASYIPPNANHVFHLVVGNGNFSFSGTGWQVFSLDSVFVWDGHSNVLFSVINNTSSNWNMTPTFANHVSARKHSMWGTRMNGNISLSSLNVQLDAFPIPTVTGDLMLMATEPLAACPMPTLLHATNVTHNSALLHWGGTASAFQLHYTSGSNDNWSAPVVVSDSNYQLVNLEALTSYYFQVRGVCIDGVTGDTTFSEWMDLTFTTPDMPCFKPTVLTQTAVTFGSATFNWTENGGAGLWKLHVWNTQYDSTFSVTTHPFTVEGMAANSEYYAAVLAQCDEERASVYSDTIAFFTVACPVVVGLTLTDITPSTATLEWGGSGEAYDVEYGDLHFSEGVNTHVVHTTTNSCTLTGLESEYEYSVSVRAQCEAGVYSPYCAQLDFITAALEGIAQAGEADVSLYPNPASDAVTIAIRGAAGVVEVVLVDLSGREVLREGVECTGDCVQALHVGGLRAGTYLVRLTGAQLNVVRKLVVNK